MSLERLDHIMSGVPSNRRPHPIANSVSPVKTARSASNQNAMCWEVCAGISSTRATWLPEAERVALVEADVDAGNARGILGGADDLHAERLLEREIAADMVGMVMRGENVGELQPPGFERALDRFGFGGVDNAADALGAVEDEVGVVVLETGNEFDFERGHGRHH